MSNESDSIRIARIEEGIVRVHERIANNHNEVMRALLPVVKEARTNTEDLIRIKQNNRWVYSLVVVGPSSLLAIFEWWFHYGKAS